MGNGELGIGNWEWGIGNWELLHHCFWANFLYNIVNLSIYQITYNVDILQQIYYI